MARQHCSQAGASHATTLSIQADIRRFLLSFWTLSLSVSFSSRFSLRFVRFNNTQARTTNFPIPEKALFSTQNAESDRGREF